MATLKVLIATEMEERHIKAIAAAHPDVEVSYIANSPFGISRGSRPAEDSPLLAADQDTAIREAEVMLSFRLPPDVLSLAPRLKWVQLGFAGADGLFGNPVLESDILLTTANGVAAITIAEWYMTTTLMFTKGMHLAQLNRLEKRWRRNQSRELSGRTLGIVGLGHIGSELARLAKAFSMRVVASRRSALAALPANVDAMYSREQLHDLLATSDFVAICTPLAPETMKLIGEAELKAMKQTAFILNASRGQVIDESALVRALKEGWIAGAGLDVFEKEPLAAESELWEMPNVIITPHTSNGTAYYSDRLAELFADNIRRYIGGQPLQNVVDRARGY